MFSLYAEQGPSSALKAMRHERMEMCFVQATLAGCRCTRKALARAWAPSFSRRFRPATNTLSFSGVPLAEDCLWHSIRASARICETHPPLLSTRSTGGWLAQTHRNQVSTYLSATDPHAAIVELQLPEFVAGRALQQLLNSLHTVGTKGVIAQVQLGQPGPCAHYGAAQMLLMKAHRKPMASMHSRRKTRRVVASKDTKSRNETMHRDFTVEATLTSAVGISERNLPVNMSLQWHFYKDTGNN